MRVETDGGMDREKEGEKEGRRKGGRREGRIKEKGQKNLTSFSDCLSKYL